MDKVLTFSAEMREESGSRPSKTLRKKGMVPAIIYGANRKPMAIYLKEKELLKYYRKPQYISQVFQFEVGQKKFKVLPKAIDLHPVVETVLHADFVFLEEKMQKMEVPIVYINKENCVGVKKGGYFNTIKRSLHLLCPANNLPRKIDVNVINMQIRTSLKAKEVILPKGAKLIGNVECVIASIVGKRGKSSDDNDGITEAGNAAEKEINKK